MYYVRKDKTRTVSLSPSPWQSLTPARPPPRPITPRPQSRLKIQAAYKGPAMPSLSLGCPTYLGCGIGSEVAGCGGPSSNDECTLASTIFNFIITLRHPFVCIQIQLQRYTYHGGTTSNYYKSTLWSTRRAGSSFL